MKSARPRVVVVGAGFGGLEAARKLARAPVGVTVIDRHNYHLFQPLLCQVATAALSRADIAEPIRAVLRGQQNATVLLDEVIGVDAAARRIELRFGPPQSYDFLVLATGSQYAYFGHEDWPRLAPGLKSIDDAALIRRRMLLAFEEAETVADPTVQRRLLTFVPIGAGPTGVEMAGTLAELAHATLSRDFRHINPQMAHILLIEAGPRVLSGFPEKLAAFARRSLEKMRVEVWSIRRSKRSTKPASSREATASRRQTSSGAPVSRPRPLHDGSTPRPAGEAASRSLPISPSPVTRRSSLSAMPLLSPAPMASHYLGSHPSPSTKDTMSAT